MGTRLGPCPDQFARSGDSNRLVVSSRERQKRYGARPLYGRRKYSLMTRTVSRDSTRRHLAPLGDELRERPDVLVINLQCFVGAKTTYLATKHRPPPWRSLVIVATLPRPPGSFPSVLCHVFYTSIRAGRRANFLRPNKSTATVETLAIASSRNDCLVPTSRDR
jgi:hypothetical protein